MRRRHRVSSGDIENLPEDVEVIEDYLVEAGTCSGEESSPESCNTYSCPSTPGK